MAVTVDQSKLVLNSFAAIFQNALLSGDIVSWKEYDGELNDRNGLNVSEQVGPRYKVTQTTNGVQDLTAGTQDTVFGSEQFKVDQTFGTSMGWGDFVKIRDIGDARESEALSNAAVNLAEQIDAYVLGFAALASNNWVGTPGDNIDDFDQFMSGYTRLKEEGVSDDNLRGVLPFIDKQKLGKQVAVIPNDNGASPNTLRVGFKGDLGGVPTMFTQQLPVLTMGTRAATGAALINGGAQNVNYKAVAVSSAPGFYMSQTLAVDGLAANATIKDGEVFTLVDVYAYDNRKQASKGYLQQFRVIGDTTASGAGAIAALRIFPAIIVPAAGATGDNAVNTANATVDSIPADNAAMSFLGTASTQYMPRMIIQKQAIVVSTQQLILPVTGQGMRRKLTNVPLSVRMWKNSDFNTGFHGVRFDVALNANVRDRRRVVRINGTNAP